MDSIYNVNTFTNPGGEFIRQSRFFDKESAIQKAKDAVAENPGTQAIVTELNTVGSAYTIFRVFSEPKATEVPATVETVSAAFRKLSLGDQRAVVIGLVKERLEAGDLKSLFGTQGVLGLR